jgi:hypothetical protein
LISPPQTGVPHDASERATWNIVGQMSGHHHSAIFGRVMELSVTSTLSTKEPIARFNRREDFPYRHDLATVARGITF